jgi:hypothetical protein
METQIFHHAKNIIFKKSSKRNQNPSTYYNSITNLKFQQKPKMSSFKNPHIKADLLLPRDQNPLSYLYSIMNLNTISLPWPANPINREVTMRKEQGQLITIHLISYSRRPKA